jgi:hypothetical protein
MPTPYKQQIQDQLWVLLEAHAPFATLISAGKREKQTEHAGWLRKSMLRSPGDYPTVAIDNGRFTLSGYTINRTFADEAPAASLADVADMPIRRRCEFTIIVTGRDLESDNIDPAEEETQIAILKGGPRLGLSAFVLEWGPLEAQQRTINVDGQPVTTGGARLQSVMRLPVIVEVPAKTLTG